MAWSDIIGLLRGQNKRSAGNAESEEGEPSPESAALRRVLHTPGAEPAAADTPSVSSATDESTARPAFGHTVAETAEAEPEEFAIPELRNAERLADSHSLFPQPETAAPDAIRPERDRPEAKAPEHEGLEFEGPEFEDLEPEYFEPSYLQSGHLEPSYLKSLYPVSSQALPARPAAALDASRLGATPVSAAAIPVRVPASPAAAAQPAAEPVSEMEELVDRWAAARRSGSRPVYSTPSEPLAPEPDPWARFAVSVPPPPPVTAAPFAMPPPPAAVVEAPAPLEAVSFAPVSVPPLAPGHEEPEAPRLVHTRFDPETFQPEADEEPESYVVLPDPDPDPVFEPAAEPHESFHFAGPLEHTWPMPEPEPITMASEPDVTAEPDFITAIPESIPRTVPVPEPVPIPEAVFIPEAVPAVEAEPTPEPVSQAAPEPAPAAEPPAAPEPPAAWEPQSAASEPEPIAADISVEPPAPPVPERPPAWPLTVPGPSTPEWPSSRSSPVAGPRFAMLRAVAQRWNQPLAERRFLVAAGSRAEARRLAPVIRTLRARGMAAHGLDEVCVCAAGDSPQSVREALELLDIGVDCHLSVEGANQSLDALRARLLNSFESVFAQVKPQWLVVAGDTMMTGMASLAAYYAGIHVARVDAGHTTSTAGDELQPDEIYRQLVDLFSAVHFTETEWSKERLIHEGVLEENILVTGNTGVDALYESCQRLNLPLGPLSSRSSGVSRVLVSVGHRSLPEGSAGEICRAIGNLAVLVPGLYEFTWPLPPGLEASEAVHKILARVPGVRLTPPASYEEFLRHLSHCDFVLTDSPDLLEEAPSLGKPVLLLGAAGQRNEAIRTGVAIPVTPDSKSIQVAVRGLARKLSTRHGQITNPYGDGKASARIADFFEGRRILEFGHTALPRLTTTSDEPLRIAESVTRWRLES